MKRWVPVVVAAAALVVAYVWLLRAPERRQAKVEAAQPPAVREDERPTPAAGPEPAPSAEREGATEQARTEQRDGHASTWRPMGNPAVVLMPAFEREPRDALWADQAEREIRELLDHEELPDDLLEGADCRTTVCRIQLRWREDRDAGLKRLNLLLQERYAPILGMDYPTGTGALRALDFYVLRDGYSLSDAAGR